jgi:hypothetical protein
MRLVVLLLLHVHGQVEFRRRRGPATSIDQLQQFKGQGFSDNGGMKVLGLAEKDVQNAVDSLAQTFEAIKADFVKAITLGKIGGAEAVREQVTKQKKDVNELKRKLTKVWSEMTKITGAGRISNRDIENLVTQVKTQNSQAITALKMENRTRLENFLSNFKKLKSLTDRFIVPLTEVFQVAKSGALEKVQTGCI